MSSSHADTVVHQLTVEVAMTSNFFDLHNFSIWLLWIILIGVLLLLLAVKKNMRVLSDARILPKSHSATELAGISTNSSASPTGNRPQTRAKQPLVQPVKVVKIRVRKVRSQRISV